MKLRGSNGTTSAIQTDNSTDVIKINDSTGKVGIGTDPSYVLHMSTTENATKLFKFQGQYTSLYGYSDASGAGITFSDPYSNTSLVYLKLGLKLYYKGL